MHSSHVSDVQRWISVATRGHIGLSRLLTDCLVNHYKSSTGRPTSEEMIKFLNSDVVLDSLRGSRAVPRDSMQHPVLQELLEKPVHSKSVPSTELHSLIASGWAIIGHGSMLEFTAPIIRRVLLDRTLKSRTAPDSLSTCVFNALKKLHTWSLKATWSTNAAGSRVCETQWQHLFHHALMSCVPEDWVISADFGHSIGSAGKLDFYISSLKVGWGVELLVDGNNRMEHVRRFKQGGRYAQFVDDGYVEDWIVIDFRRSRSAVPLKEDWFWEAVYSDNYSKLTVYHSGSVHHIQPLFATASQLQDSFATLHLEENSNTPPRSVSGVDSSSSPSQRSVVAMLAAKTAASLAPPHFKNYPRNELSYCMPVTSVVVSLRCKHSILFFAISSADLLDLMN
jgi:hypothetical protein